MASGLPSASNPSASNPFGIPTAQYPPYMLGQMQYAQNGGQSGLVAPPMIRDPGPMPQTQDPFGLMPPPSSHTELLMPPAQDPFGVMNPSGTDTGQAALPPAQDPFGFGTQPPPDPQGGGFFNVGQPGYGEPGGLIGPPEPPAGYGQPGGLIGPPLPPDFVGPSDPNGPNIPDLGPVDPFTGMPVNQNDFQDTFNGGGTSQQNTSGLGGGSPSNIPGGYTGYGYDPFGTGGLTPDQMSYLNSGAGVNPANPYNMGYNGAFPGNNPNGGFGPGGGLGGGPGGGSGILGSMYGAAASMFGSAQDAAARNLASQLGLQGSLASTAAQKQLGLAGIANQIPAINAQNAPAMAALAWKKSLLEPGGALSGLLGSLTGQGGGGGQNGTPPPLPSTHFIDPELLKQGLANIDARNSTRFATLANAQRQAGASNGFNTTANAPGSVNGVNAELASENAMRQGMMNQANERDWNIGMAQNNAQQANAVGQMAQNQYNAAQNRLLDRLRMGLGFVGGIVG